MPSSGRFEGKGGERYSQRLGIRDGVEEKHLVGNTNASHNSGQPPAAAAGFYVLNLLYRSEWEPVEGRLINKSISSVMQFMVVYFAPTSPILIHSEPPRSSSQLHSRG